jgi:hypothetical protein
VVRRKHTCDSANSSMHEQVPYKPTGKWVGHVAVVCLCFYQPPTICSDRSGLTSLPGQFMWDSWWTKWHWQTFLSGYLTNPCQYHSTDGPYPFIYHLTDGRSVHQTRAVNSTFPRHKTEGHVETGINYFLSWTSCIYTFVP